ncbi:hypothetical protein, partial [Hungatella sp.]|uniref:hypothetical protein n=1 Tax=Hungatella sp. TaxID=2613924 RepID=UPI00399637C2
QNFSFRGNAHLSERSEFGDFHWFLEKSCTFRTAYARNRSWEPGGNRQNRTRRRQPQAGSRQQGIAGRMEVTYVM